MLTIGSLLLFLPSYIGCSRSVTDPTFYSLDCAVFLLPYTSLLRIVPLVLRHRGLKTNLWRCTLPLIVRLPPPPSPRCRLVSLCGASVVRLSSVTRLL